MDQPPQLEVACNAFELCLEHFDAQLWIQLRDPIRDFGVAPNGLGEHDIVAVGETLDTCGDVDGRAKIVEAIVECDGDAGAVMDAYLEHERMLNGRQRGKRHLRL